MVLASLFWLILQKAILSNELVSAGAESESPIINNDITAEQKSVGCLHISGRCWVKVQGVVLAALHLLSEVQDGPSNRSGGNRAPTLPVSHGCISEK